MIRRSPVFIAKADAFGPDQRRVLKAVRRFRQAEYLIDSTDAHRHVLAGAKYSNDEIEREPDRTGRAVSLFVEALLAFGVEQGLAVAGARFSPYERADRDRLETIFAAYKKVPDPASDARDELSDAERSANQKKEQALATEDRRYWAHQKVTLLKAELATAEKALADAEAAAAKAKADREAAEAKLPALRERVQLLEAGEQQLEREELAAMTARAQARAEREKEEAREREAAQRRALEAECRKSSQEQVARKKAEAMAEDELLAAAERAKGKQR
jgi:hypothetical protein